MIVVFHEKHGDRVVQGRDAFLDVLKERVAQGYWYDNWEEGDPRTEWATRAAAIVERDDNRAAQTFMEERLDHEYEGFEVHEDEAEAKRWQEHAASLDEE